MTNFIKDEKYTLPAKMEKYLLNGVQPAWMVVDSLPQQTTVYRSDQEPVIKPFGDVLRGDAILPGFELRLSEIVY